jgi:Rod binding domain-containing protein
MGTGIGIDTSGISAANSGFPQVPTYSGQVGDMSNAQMDKVAKDFESMFIGEMLQPMFGDTEGSDAFGSAESNDVYKGLLMDEYGKQITRAGGIGVADFVKKELLKLQEVTHPANRKAASQNG